MLRLTGLKGTGNHAILLFKHVQNFGELIYVYRSKYIFISTFITVVVWEVLCLQNFYYSSVYIISLSKLHKNYSIVEHKARESAHPLAGGL